MLGLSFILSQWLYAQELPNAIRCRKDTQYRFTFIEQQKNGRWVCQSVKRTHLENAGFFKSAEEAQTCLNQAEEAFKSLGWACDKINLKKVVW